MQEKVLSISTAGIDTTLLPVRGRVVKSKWARNLLTFLMVFGPGLIVMEADNDAGAVSTYIQAGAQYGTRLLWTLLILLPVCYFIQEMVVRLGIATGKGHAAMIYQRFGKWWGLFSLVDLELVNFLTLVTEFAAIALAVRHFGISPYLGVPFAAVGLITMVLTGSFADGSALPSFSAFSTLHGSRSHGSCGRPSGNWHTTASFPEFQWEALLPGWFSW